MTELTHQTEKQGADGPYSISVCICYESTVPSHCQALSHCPNIPDSSVVIVQHTRLQVQLPIILLAIILFQFIE